MAVTRATLQIIAGENDEVGVVGLYRTADNAATVEGNDYFNTVQDKLPGKGFILAIMGDEKHLYGYTNTAGDVALENVVAAI